MQHYWKEVTRREGVSKNGEKTVFLVGRRDDGAMYTVYTPDSVFDLEVERARLDSYLDAVYPFPLPQEMPSGC